MRKCRWILETELLQFFKNGIILFLSNMYFWLYSTHSFGVMFSLVIVMLMPVTVYCKFWIPWWYNGQVESMSEISLPLLVSLSCIVPRQMSRFGFFFIFKFFLSQFYHFYVYYYLDLGAAIALHCKINVSGSIIFLFPLCFRRNVLFLHVILNLY